MHDTQHIKDNLLISRIEILMKCDMNWIVLTMSIFIVSLK